MQKAHMKDLNHGPGSQRMPISNGKFDPAKLLQSDLDDVLQQASSAKAEVLIYGDFNERWYQESGGNQKKGPWRTWVESHPIKNILQTDEMSINNATCFLNPKNPSDIDWVLASGRLGSSDISPHCSGQHARHGPPTSLARRKIP